MNLKRLLRKNHTNLIRKQTKNYNYCPLTFGQYGLQSIESGILTTKQVESARRSLSKVLKRKCKIWIRVSFTTMSTAKPREVRMGKGKGSLDQKISFIKRGDILFEVGFITKQVAKLVFLKAGKKLPILTKLIIK